jgi:hypothetical protein
MDFKLIKTQLKQDLIGKDAYRGITLSYAWLANQFGHIGLGFLPASLIYSFCYSDNTNALIKYLPALVVWLIWVYFEFKNFTISIFSNSEHSIIVEKAKINFYHPRKWHFRYDLITDLSFFAFGTALAGLVFSHNVIFTLICLAIVPWLIYQSAYWYPAKIYLQKALFPIQFRLSQWSRHISEDNKEAINTFMDDNNTCTHLLVFGEDDDEKLHLCIGIGAELSYKLKKCRYLTAMKAFECFYREAAEDSNEEVYRNSWNWHEAEVLVIDDINPSHAKIEELIKPDQFFNIINNKNADRNLNYLKKKKIIWMLGDEVEDDKEKAQWVNLLLNIGVNKMDIITIDLANKLAAV